MNEYTNIPARLVSNSTIRDDLATTTTNNTINKPKQIRNIFCYTSILFYIGIFIFFFINFILTKDNLIHKQAPRIPYEILCEPFINDYKRCITKKATNNSTVVIDCRNKSLNIETCMNEVRDFNQKCQLYINELYLCTENDDVKLKNKYICPRQKADLYRCNKYSWINLKLILEN